MQKLLLDTHIWLWYALGEKKLPERSKKLIENEKNILFLSAISIWECLLLHERKRINLGSNPEKWIETVLTNLPVNELPISFEIAVQSRKLDVSISDPADRFILASAIIHSCSLMTEDKKLKTTALVHVI